MSSLSNNLAMCAAQWITAQCCTAQWTFRKQEFLYSERGSTALYLVLLLPLLLALAALGVDVSGWNALRTDLQREAERLALEAARRLPNETAVSDFLTAEQSVLGESLLIERFSPDGSRGAAVGVRVSARLKPGFASLMQSFLPSPQSSVFAVRKEAIAQLVPTDAVVIMADSSTLRPRLMFGGDGAIAGFESPWGDESIWPASSYLACVLAPQVSPALGWKWWELWNDVGFKRWMTESCYNPVLSNIKAATLEVVERIVAHRQNRLALLFTPGSSNRSSAVVSRHLTQSFSSGEQGGFVRAGLPSAKWADYSEFERFLGDNACVLLSESTTAEDGVYSFDVGTRQHEVDGGEDCSSATKDFVCGLRHNPQASVNSCFLMENLTVYGSIYWHAARLGLAGETLYPNIEEALTVAWSEIKTPESSESERVLGREERGEFADSQHRRVILITDFLPELIPDSRLEEILQSYALNHIELLIFAVKHQGLRAVELGQFEEHLQSWQLRANRTTERERGVYRLFIADSPEDLRAQVSRVLAALGQRVILRG